MDIETDDRTLIARSQKDDLNAFNALVERYQRGLYNLCLRLLASPQAAEDATQEAFLAAYRSLHRFRGGSFRAWLFRIAANGCYDEMRRRRSRPTVSIDVSHGEGVLDVPNPGSTLDEEVQRLELQRTLQKTLSALPADQRLAVILRDAQGLDYAEIAQVTGVSLGTVKSRISRARQRLRVLLASHWELLPPRFRQSSERER